MTTQTKRQQQHPPKGASSSAVVLSAIRCCCRGRRIGCLRLLFIFVGIFAIVQQTLVFQRQEGVLLSSNKRQEQQWGDQPIHVNATSGAAAATAMDKNSSIGNYGVPMSFPLEESTSVPESSVIRNKTVRLDDSFKKRSQESPGSTTAASAPFSYAPLIQMYFEEIEAAAHYNDKEISWIREYVTWHEEMRLRYPEESILHLKSPDNGEPTHNNNSTTIQFPKVAIAYLDPNKHHGGLTDRMKGIGHLMKKCFKDRQVLFFKWYGNAPADLEEFLIPHLFNWTLPMDKTTRTPQALQQHYNNSKQVQLIRFTHQLGNFLHPFRVVWNVAFRPSPRVQRLYQQAMQQHQLEPQHFDALHCRMGHPAHRNKKAYTATSKKKDIVQGYPFEGVHRIHAMDAATRGIQCLHYLLDKNNNNNKRDVQNDNVTATTSSSEFPLYFYSDSADLIDTVIHPLTLRAKLTDQHVDQLHALQRLENTTLHYPYRMEGRTNVPIAHLEREVSKRGNVSSLAIAGTKTATIDDDNDHENIFLDTHANTFVDLYIASQARCIGIGVGRFAYMAAKLAETTCWIRHATHVDSAVSSQWGMTQMNKQVPNCPL